MKTYSTKASEIHKEWHVIDASGMVLGRLATDVARILRGKDKVIFAPHLDTGDNVIVVNAEKVRVTGKKAAQKTYYRHSQYPGGFKSTTYEKVAKAHPTRVVEHAIRGMLPRNKLGDEMFRNLRVYAGPTHPHEAQLNVKTTVPPAEVSEPVASALRETQPPEAVVEESPELAVEATREEAAEAAPEEKEA